MLVILTILCVGCGREVYSYVDFQNIDHNITDEHNTAFKENRPLRIAVPAIMSPRKTIVYYRDILEYISKRINRPVVLIERQTYDEINQLLSSDGADIAFLSTGAYGAYRGLAEIEVLAMQELNGSAYYNSYIIVSKDSSIKNFEDLRGKTFAFTDPLSYSGHVSVLRKLEALHEYPETFFSRYVYTYSHDKALLAVANGVVDGGALESPAYEYEKLTMPQVADSVKIIAVLGPAAMGPVVVRKDMDSQLKLDLQQAFLDMDKNEYLKPALQGLTLDRFIQPIPGAYESVIKARLP